jgi:hypothetical protein
VVVDNSAALDREAFCFELAEELLLTIDQLLALGGVIVVADDADIVALGGQRSATGKEERETGIVKPGASGNFRFAEALIKIGSVDVDGNALG